MLRFYQPPPADTTSPVIVPNVSGPVGTNGWYVEDRSPRAHRYELRRGEDVIGTGHLSRDQPLEVDDESRSAGGELALRLSNHCCRGFQSFLPVAAVFAGVLDAARTAGRSHRRFLVSRAREHLELNAEPRTER